MPVEENKAVVRRFVDEVINQGNDAALEELIADDCDIVGALAIGRGPDIFRHVFRLMRAAFPDFHLAIEEMVGEGDTVVLRVIESGTHRGTFLGVAPTGKACAWGGVNIVRVADGKLVRSWGMRDQLGLLRQLGATAVPPAPQTRSMPSE
jgi:steroid delta-isomerase-like uncharacterized protein